MPTRKIAVLLAAFVATCAFVGVQGGRYRAALSYTACIGKTYGTPGCPLKQQSRTCGDGRVDDNEECDNGAERNGQGNCSATCMFLACGDGVLSTDLGEECEPKREEVYAIDPETNELTTELRFMAATCGETCTAPTCGDDGACIGGCRKAEKPACGPSVSAREALVEDSRTGSSSSSSAPAVGEAYVARCGNGVRDPGEQCDDGNAFDTDGCTIACRLPRCGDGSVQEGEQCDDGNDLNNDACTNECKRAACGDGIVQANEQCDRGGNNSDYLPNACRSDCSAPRCGDRVVDNGEECDGGDSCTSGCQRVKSAASLVVETPGTGKIAIALSLAGGVLVLAYILRRVVHRAVHRVAGEKIARSIDDIPLDEIEMPWHSWGGDGQ